MINHPIPNDGFPSIHNHYPTILQLLTIIIPIYTVTTITTNNYKQSLTIIISNILLTITNNYLQLLLFSDSPKKRFAPKKSWLPAQAAEKIVAPRCAAKAYCWE